MMYGRPKKKKKTHKFAAPNGNKERRQLTRDPKGMKKRDDGDGQH